MHCRHTSKFLSCTAQIEATVHTQVDAKLALFKLNRPTRNNSARTKPRKMLKDKLSVQGKVLIHSYVIAAWRSVFSYSTMAYESTYYTFFITFFIHLILLCFWTRLACSFTIITLNCTSCFVHWISLGEEILLDNVRIEAQFNSIFFRTVIFFFRGHLYASS